MNFVSNHKRIVALLFALAAVSFLWLSTFGLLHDMNGTESDGTMGGCLFNAQPTCAMNFSEHAVIWEGMMIVLPLKAEQTGSFALALLVTVVVSFVFLLYEYHPESGGIFNRLRLYARQHPQIKLFNQTAEVFSQGILNPKIFAPVSI